MIMAAHPRTMRITTTCKQCKKDVVVMVAKADFVAWKRGELAQRAFPYLTADEREVLISKICGPCFDSMYGPCPEG
jgi:hypothetical protein